jgi:hypothetical protein
MGRPYITLALHSSRLVRYSQEAALHQPHQGHGRERARPPHGTKNSEVQQYHDLRKKVS